jgi:hypothetical protein
VLLNAVLNAIPIFYLSFLKMPLKVRKKVIRIQREFLWGGGEGWKKDLLGEMVGDLQGEKAWRVGGARYWHSQS